MPERPYVPGPDDAAVLALRAKVWGADHPHGSAAFFKWLFRDKPNGPGGGIISHKDGQVLGFAGYCRRSAAIGSTRLRIAHELEFMVDPDISGILSGRVGMRVVSGIAKLVRELGYDSSLNFPNDNSHRMLTSKLSRYEPVFSPDLFVRPLPGYTVSAEEYPSALKRLVMTIGGRAAASYSRIRAAGTAPGSGIEPITMFDERFDDFWGRLQRDGRLRFMRDAKTLNWRYVGHPVYHYSILAAASGGEISGYIVTSPRDVMGTRARLICDFAVAPDGPDTTRLRQSLLGAAIDEARASGAAAIVTECTQKDPVRGALARCGFLAIPPKLNPKPFRMVAKQFTDRGAATLHGDAWSFSWGDMDVV